MKRKETMTLYRENTSKYTKAYNLFQKLDWFVVPVLFLGVFLGSDGIDLLCTIGLLIFAFTQLILLILDSYNRIKIGKQKINC
ncbi:hypothetical protein BAU15_14115 [Enterococcus sp. JM4C]|uniref:hypothetical protein n=1 Tax=Candidatus Enterococcus huntleyi TaxID=1857217 RepID=UPI00137ABEF8|nr:hypothetical protein [Enterococcus sp. JM4C]KAF1296003.1 hypothetical protein BAU15_14115 [Enterococcus sp. JM4C]